MEKLLKVKMSIIEQKLKNIGLSLPEIAVPVANYVPIVRHGNMIFLSGHIPRNPDGSPVNGRIGENVSTSQGYELARQVTLSLLATIKSEIGDLDKVEQIIKIVCIMNAPSDYTEHPVVANGASDLLVEVFGDSGRHSRVAIGAGSLPGGVPIEIELTAVVSG